MSEFKAYEDVVKAIIMRVAGTVADFPGVRSEEAIKKSGEEVDSL